MLEKYFVRMPVTQINYIFIYCYYGPLIHSQDRNRVLEQVDAVELAGRRGRRQAGNAARNGGVALEAGRVRAYLR